MRWSRGKGELSDRCDDRNRRTERTRAHIGSAAASIRWRRPSATDSAKDTARLRRMQWLGGRRCAEGGGSDLTLPPPPLAVDALAAAAEAEELTQTSLARALALVALRSNAATAIRCDCASAAECVCVCAAEGTTGINVEHFMYCIVHLRAVMHKHTLIYTSIVKFSYSYYTLHVFLLCK